jgi:porphobilinogen synthase
MAYTPTQRLKRLRKTKAVRTMLQETRLHASNLIAPLFVHETIQKPTAIQSMPGCYQLPLSALTDELNTLEKLGIQAVLLFGIPATKDLTGSCSLKADGIIQQAIRNIKETHPNMLVIADACFCEYTSHGHCGTLNDEMIDNDATLKMLGTQAVSFADAGADWIAPSGMTDGMVGAIREALDNAAHQDVAILSYAVKYSSCFYGPFREAADGAPQFGDRKTYQMDPANASEALREAALDVDEGADILMVKPAMAYLDIIYRIKTRFPDVPLCAYQVSGEYAMIKAAAKAGLIDEQSAMLESTLAIKRAGADLIITYFAKELAETIQRHCEP